MQQYYDLEINILSCLLQKPKLMQQVKLEDKYFIKHNRLWQFMKAFYARYGTFDLILMYNTCKDKYQLIRYIEWLVDVEPIPDHFSKYQDQLIELYNQKKNEKAIVNYIYELANKLLVGSMTLTEFYGKIEEIKEKEVEK